MPSSTLGIDVAAHTLALCHVSPSTGEVQHFSIENSVPALNTFLEEHPDLMTQNCTVGMESTGDYHLTAAQFFLDQGMSVKLLNPILTKQYTRTTIRGTKTDRTDAEIICKLLQEEHGEPLSLAAVRNRQKELLRLAHLLKKNKQQLLLRLQSTKRKNVGDTEKFEKQIEAIIDNLDQLSQQLIDDVTVERSHDEELIDSIPGFAVHLSAVVYHEIGGIRRFKNAKSLVAFAGLDPRIRQSGASLNSKGRITKRGSAQLRHALYLAANIARQHDSDLKAYYEKKKSEGRSHNEALCMISRKLLHRIWSCIKNDRDYQRKQE